MCSETILVAGNGDHTMGQMADSLRNCGHRVLIATDEEETLHRARSERPDLVIVDTRPPARDGVRICRCLKENPGTHAIKVLLLCEEKREDRSARYPGEADGMLCSPVSGEKLMDEVARLI